SEAASRAKVELSSNASTTLRFPFIEKGKTFEVELTRDRFEGLIEKTIRKTVGCCRRAMSDAGMAPEDLDEVILVGGTTRIPAVRRLVEEVYLKTPNISQNPDEAVAIGAAIQAGILEGAVQKMVLLDVTPLSLGIETFGGLMNVIIPRNTTIPAKAGEMFTNAAAGQESLLVRVLQGERELAKDNWRLGEFVLPFEPGPKGSARVGVQFKIDENGILEILMRDQHRKLDQVFEIEDVVIDVDDSAVESMIEESIEFAFDDLAERKHVELRQKAEELISSVDIALEKLGDKLGQTVRDQILEAASATRQCLDQRDDERLPGAINHLEKVTDPVAALLLERLLDVADDR
ncbi:MAG: Hsp70 family protein, partial [Verrucomicrobiales bacterium]|nr:Hsp70 family protein [Verrucomicrobiales bacterium]